MSGEGAGGAPHAGLGALTSSHAQRPAQSTARGWIGEVFDAPIVDVLAAAGKVWDHHADLACWRCRRPGAVVHFDIEAMRGRCDTCTRHIDPLDVCLHVLRDPRALARYRKAHR